MILRVVWNDAVAQWPQAWQEARDIAEGLDTTTVDTIGHVVEIEGRDDYLVLASSASGSMHTLGGVQYGGVTAIPKGMIVSQTIVSPD